ncbi:high mobility group box domain-containing protein, partial [Crepidotus variabilis]
MPYVPDPKKKSHARKQPEGHIPRARNPFMLFRCNFVDQRLVPSFEETDHRNISRIAGRIWQDMMEEEKVPWVEMAAAEKLEHMKKH